MKPRKNLRNGEAPRVPSTLRVLDEKDLCEASGGATKGQRKGEPVLYLQFTFKLVSVG